MVVQGVSDTVQGQILDIEVIKEGLINEAREEVTMKSSPSQVKSTPNPFMYGYTENRPEVEYTAPKRKTSTDESRREKEDLLKQLFTGDNGPNITRQTKLSQGKITLNKHQNHGSWKNSCATFGSLS